jgi:hypothetical protein
MGRADGSGKRGSAFEDVDELAVPDQFVDGATINPIIGA